MALDQECLEFSNAAVAVRCAKIDHRVNASQRHRRSAAALLDNDRVYERAQGYRYLPKLRVALQQELKIK